MGGGLGGSVPSPPTRPSCQSLSTLRRRYLRSLPAVNTRPALLYTLLPLACLLLSALLGTHYHHYQRRSFLYTDGFHPLSLSSWRALGLRGGDVYVLWEQLALCGREVGQALWREGEALVQRLSGMV